ncbi:hypothetical protein T439DRAFT_216724 [Meredithblackwellia eburnea MCA 4105]
MAMFQQFQTRETQVCQSQRSLLARQPCQGKVFLWTLPRPSDHLTPQPRRSHQLQLFLLHLLCLPLRQRSSPPACPLTKSSSRRLARRATASKPVGHHTAPPGAGRGMSFDRGRGSFGPGHFGRGRGTAVWGARGMPSGHDLNMGIGGDFPTAQEAANAKALRAQRLLEQMQSRDRAIQARAAAAAAANAHLLEGLDAFRGVHLDPNASHWDEMGDEDTDFLDDTIEFGDGTQYKIEDTHFASMSDHHDGHLLEEPHPADMATLEAPLLPGESTDVHEGEREERFKDDYDRSWPQRQPSGDKSLFNDRLGKLEPYSGGASRKVAEDGPPKVLSHPRSDVLSPRAEKASFPTPAPLPPPQPRPDPPRAWGRIEQPPVARGSEWGPPVSGGRRLSGEQRPRRPSNEPAPRRPSIEQGGRQLPPHLSSTTGSVSSRGLDRHHEPPPHVRQPQSPPAPPFRSLPSAASVLSPPQPHPSELPSTDSAHITPAPPTVDSTPVDLEEMHAREMHAAAERAKQRRLDEEQREQERKERAKKKAAEVEEKLRQAKANETSAVKPTQAVTGRQGGATSTSRSGTNDVPEVESWRKPPAVSLSSKAEPTQILARDAKPPPGTERPSPPQQSAPLPEKQVWRRGAPIPPPSKPPAVSEAPLLKKQVPPHLIGPPKSPPSVATSTFTTLASPPIVSSADPPPSSTTALLAGPTIPSPVIDEGPSVPSADQPVDAPSSPSTSRKVTSPLLKGGSFKVPAISTFEDTMSRIRGAMAPQKEDPVETVSREASPPIPLPTVKLPTSTLQPSAEILPLLAHSANIATGLSPSIPSSLDRHAPITQSRASGALTAKGSTSKKGAHPLPLFESREAMPLFDRTRMERPASPPPPWKKNAVRLAPYSPRPFPSHRSVKGFHNPHEPARVNVSSWHFAPNSGRFGSEGLIPKPFRHGKPVVEVKIIAALLRRGDALESFPAELFTLRPRTSKVDHVTSASIVSNVISSSTVEPVSDLEIYGLDATTVPDTASLFDVQPSRARAPSKAKHSSSSTESSYFNSPPSVLPSMTSGSDAISKFMVTALNGEEVVKVPRESLTAPGADSSGHGRELLYQPQFFHLLQPALGRINHL